MTRTAVALLAIAAADCGSYRRVAPLDAAERTELGGLRTRLTGRRVFAAGTDGAGAPDARISEALTELGFDLVPSPEASSAEVHASGPFGVCMNPMLGSAMTLGILPYTMPSATRFRFRLVDADGRETARELDMDDAATFGWLALPLGVLPGRSPFFFGWGRPGDADRAAIRDRLALFLGHQFAEPIR